jgi:ABC-type polysaccharide/polyol phosphate export permease
MSFVFLSMFFGFMGWLQMPEDVLQIATAWVMLAWFGAGLAILLAALSETSEIIDKLWHPMSYLLFPLSGAAFLVDALPKAAQDIVLWLPMVNGVEYLREGYFGSQIVAHYDLTYMAMANLTLTILGLAYLRKVSREVIPE